MPEAPRHPWRRLPVDRLVNHSEVYASHDEHCRRLAEALPPVSPRERVLTDRILRDRRYARRN